VANNKGQYMTKKQKRLYKLANAARRVKGGVYTPPDASKGALDHLKRRLEICKAHGDQ
jgi:hypothetical protein